MGTKQFSSEEVGKALQILVEWGKSKSEAKPVEVGKPASKACGNK